MNRKAEGIVNIIAVTRARVRADMEALGSLADSLERITVEEYDSMAIEEWGQHKALAEKVQAERSAYLRGIGAVPPLPPAHDSKALLGGAAERKPARPRLPAGRVKRGGHR